jgi:hypothetical protein
MSPPKIAKNKPTIPYAIHPVFHSASTTSPNLTASLKSENEWGWWDREHPLPSTTTL